MEARRRGRVGHGVLSLIAIALLGLLEPPSVAFQAVTVPAKKQQSDAGDADSRRLTNAIGNARSASELVALLDQHLETPTFGDIQVHATLNKLAKEKSTINSQVRSSAAMRSLLARAEKKLSGSKPTPRFAALLLRVTGKVSREMPEVLSLADQLILVVATTLSGMDPIDVGKCVWALGTLQMKEAWIPQITPSLVRALERVMDTLSPQDLAHLLWTTAKLHRRMPELLDLLPGARKAISEKLEKMNSQDLSIIMWATANLKSASLELQEMLPEIVGLLAKMGQQLKAQDISNIFWAAATLRDVMPDLLVEALPTFTSVFVARSSYAKPQELSQAVWAMASLGSDSEAVQEAHKQLAPRVAALAPKMTLQGLSTVAWGYALSGVPEKAVLDAVAAAVLKVSQFMPPEETAMEARQNLPLLIWAYAKLAAPHEELFKALSKRLEPLLRQPSDWGVCAMAWGLKATQLPELDAFRAQVWADVDRRGFLPEAVERSAEGPDAWYRWQYE